MVKHRKVKRSEYTGGEVPRDSRSLRYGKGKCTDSRGRDTYSTGLTRESLHPHSTSPFLVFLLVFGSLSLSTAICEKFYFLIDTFDFS